MAFDGLMLLNVMMLVPCFVPLKVNMSAPGAPGIETLLAMYARFMNVMAELS